MMKSMTVKELYEQVRDGKIVSDIGLQREIIYPPEKQALVIDSIATGIPLPAFYLWENDQGVLEVLDGKQRIHSITQFIENNISYQEKLWKITEKSVQENINSCELTLIVCKGTEKQKREIFRRINTLGVALSKFEVLNGLYHGEYLRGLTQFVRNDRNLIKITNDSTRGARQYTVLTFLQGIRKFADIENYVEETKDTSFDTDQREISKYINFVADVFEDYTELRIKFNLAIKYIKDIAIWKQHSTDIDAKVKRFLKSNDAKIIPDKAKEVEDIIQAIVQNISVDPKRLFTQDDKRELLAQLVQEDGKYPCSICKKLFFENELEADHIEPWSKGGRTELSNAQLLCRPCNGKKSNR